MTRYPSFFDPSGHLNDKGVCLFVDALKLDRRAELSEHLRLHVSDCASCMARVLDLHAAIRDVPYPTGEPHPFFDRTRTEDGSGFFTVWRIAAGIVLFIGASAVVAYLFMGRHPDKLITAERPGMQSDTAVARAPQAQSRTDQFADNFIESPALQGFVGQAFRSEGVEILSPAPGEVMGDSLVFAWRGKLDHPVILRIVDNREDPVFRATVKGSRLVVRRKFTPGLYYWKLESRDELVYVGTYLVKAG